MRMSNNFCTRRDARQFIPEIDFCLNRTEQFPRPRDHTHAPPKKKKEFKFIRSARSQAEEHRAAIDAYIFDTSLALRIPAECNFDKLHT